MSKKPYQDKSRATENNPKGYDYDGDLEVNAYDDRLAVQDADRDGIVTNTEKEKYRVAQGTVTQTITEGEGGKVTTETKSPVTTLGTPQPWLDELTKEFLKKHPAVAEALVKAREGGWTQDQFNQYIENKTAFGKTRTDAQAAFDLAIAGSQSEDVQFKVDQKAEDIVNALKEKYGDDYAYDQAAVNKFARDVIRSGLTPEAERLWVAGQFRAPTPQGPGQEPAPLAGEAFNLEFSIKQMVDAYGIPSNPDYIKQLLTEGLAAKDATSWLAGKRGQFQQQAKNLYPSVADLLETSDVQTIMTPYRNMAFDLLGIPPQQQNLNDPMWNAALKGPNGTPMSIDEWQSTLKTDKRYGYTKTIRGRQDVSEMTQQLLAVFGGTKR